MDRFDNPRTTELKYMAANLSPSMELGDIQELASCLGEAQAEISRLRAENVELREALEQMLGPYATAWPDAPELQLARNALSGGRGDTES